MKRSLLAAAVLSVLAVQPALGQEVSVKDRGPHAVSLGVNEDAAGIGYWHKVSDRTDIGLDFELYYGNGDYSEYQRYVLEPAVKYYLLPTAAASPYVYAGLIGSYFRGESDMSVGKGYSAGAMGGIGLDWFPVERLSIGGHVGVRGQYHWDRQSSDNGLSSYSRNDDGFTVGTFNSGIRVNLFF